MSPGLQLLLAVGALALAAFAYRRFGPGGTSGALFVLTVRDDGVALEGTIPGKSDNEAQAFVQRMELPPGAKIWAFRDGPSFRLHFSADVPDNLQQRARNYFLNP